MLFKQLFDNETCTYTYLIADEASKEAVIIDPVKEQVPVYLDLLKSLKLTLIYALDTHVHADHITGAGDLRIQTGCQSGLHETTKSQCVSLRLKDGDELPLGKFIIKVIHTPGHTPCHSSYLIADRIFTGDCLFINGCGRTDFQAGSVEDQWNSVTKKLFNLPDDTLVYPGHDYKNQHVSCIIQEKQNNPRFKDKTKEDFIHLMNNLNLPEPKKIHEAVPANEACGLK